MSRKAVATMSWATVASAALWTVMAHTPDGSPWAVPLLVIFLVLFIIVPTGWLVLLHDWLDKRSAPAITDR